MTYEGGSVRRFTPIVLTGVLILTIATMTSQQKPVIAF